MITDELKTLVATYIKDNLFDSAKIGLGGNSTNPIADDLDVPLSAISIEPILMELAHFPQQIH